MFLNLSELKKDWRLAFPRIGLSVLGIVIASKFFVPMYPVPVTLETFAIYLIALFLNPKESFLAVAGYLIMGFSGITNFVGIHTFGYLFGMLIAAPSASYLAKRFENTIALIFVYFVVHLFGGLYLIKFVGAENVFQVGILPFVVPEFLKISLALWIKSKFSKKIIDINSNL